MHRTALFLCIALAGAAAAAAPGRVSGRVRPVKETSTLNHVLRAVPPPGPVTVDGDLRDWDRSGAVVMCNSLESPRLLARAAAMYDQDGLYLAIQFKDRTPMVNHIDPVASPARAWCGDCVQLRFNTGPHPDQAPPQPFQILHVDAYWYSDGNRATAYAVYGDMRPGGAMQKSLAEADGKGVTSAYRKDADGLGYVQELRLDWKLLRPDNGTPYKPGESVHLAIETMWGDPQYKDQAAARVTDLLNPLRPEHDMIWANPQAFGTLEFMAKGQLEPAASAKLWDELAARFGALKEAPAPTLAPALTAIAVDRPCLAERNDVEKKLNAWYAAKTAAGNQGDYYDNRDREHAAIDRKAFPQLKSFEYTPGQKLENQDYALFTGVRNCVSFGNSSTSAAPQRGGCNPRFAMMSPTGMLQGYAQYRGSNLYAYPAHHDYHPGHNGHGFHGDLLPLNNPYHLLSRGSSGSDIPFLNAAIHTSAAFAPDVKKLLLQHGLLMPTLQQLLRTAYKGGTATADYFTGIAHPAVFEGHLIDELRMVTEAHAMTADTIPPLAQVTVADAEPLLPGVNAPELARSERLSTSPCVAGFVFRNWGRFLKLDASAEASYDWQGKPLSFRWERLQGLPERVRIAPYDNGRKARITIAWHDRFPVRPGDAIHSNRVDIGVFAGNGKAWSTPAFISVLCPDNELRTYDDRDRLVDVQYAAMDTTIGFTTDCVLPADGVAPYDIRDWRELLRQVAAPADSLCGRLSATTFTDGERQALAATAAALAETLGAIEAEQKAGTGTRALHERWRASRQNAEKASRVLLAPATALGASVKDRLEAMLNAWQASPTWYLDHQAPLDTALAQAAQAVQAQVVAARGRLVELGIYQPAGATWKLRAFRKGNGEEAQRLTRAECAELQRFHLLLATRLVLPGILVRDPQFNYVDYRLLQARPEWLAFEYGSDSVKPRSVKVRAVATPPQHAPLEDP